MVSLKKKEEKEKIKVFVFFSPLCCLERNESVKGKTALYNYMEKLVKHI